MPNLGVEMVLSLPVVLKANRFSVDCLGHGLFIEQNLAVLSPWLGHLKLAEIAEFHLKPQSISNTSIHRWNRGPPT